MKSFFLNPVLNKEFKLRFRSIKSIWALLFYLAAIGFLIIAFIYMTTNGGNLYAFRSNQSREMFMALSFVQLGLIVFVTPGLTAGVISSEREKQTLNMLLTTTQSSTSIVLSKLLSSICFLFLLVIATLPLYSFVFLYGGVSPQIILKVFGQYALCMATIGSLGILFSTIIRKTIIAMVVTYSVALFLVAGTGVLFLLFQELIYRPQASQTIFPFFFAMLNPVINMLETFEPQAISYRMNSQGVDFPLTLSYVGSYLVLIVTSLALSIYKLRPKMNK